jgi:hypothetical protein
MSLTSASRFLDRAGQSASRTRPSAALSAIVYRSRAVQPLSGTELHWLTQVAQSRNRTEAITGLVVYDEGCFYQWLEGPREGLGRVMESIRRDPRHTDVEILDEHPSSMRHFGGWPMKLAAHALGAAPWQRDAIEPPAAIMNDLHLHPGEAPALLIKLSPASNTPRSEYAPREADGRAAGSLLAAPVLHDVFRTAVIPHLLSHYARSPRPSGPAWTRVGELAQLLIAADPDAASALLARLAVAESASAIAASIIEPAARALGDFWQDDVCSEFDVAIGLYRLQSAVRRIGLHAMPHYDGDAPPPAVLVVPEPGERHLLGAALHSDALWQAGWAPQSEFPATDTALQDLVHEQWFDALDLSLSPAFRRDHWLPRVSTTIAKARQASRNPGLVIVVGGRVFTEGADAGTQVGADAASTTAMNVDAVILRGLGLVH